VQQNFLWGLASPAPFLFPFLDLKRIEKEISSIINEFSSAFPMAF
jgi:hypothetical protein